MHSNHDNNHGNNPVDVDNDNADEEILAPEGTEAEADAMIEADDKPTDDAAEEKPFNEEELLELAKNEGLVDTAIESEPEIDAEAPLDLSEEQQAHITAGIETVLFMSDKPVSLPKLRATINNEVPLKAYRVLMARLRTEFAKDHRGIEIAEVSLGFQLRTKPHMASVLRKMVKTQPLKLSAATMEVLAIVAYKQPVPKDELDQIRGVDSGYVLRNLMEKRLVKIAGRSDLPGKPMVYSTTHEFLELFNLKDTASLPPLHEVEAMVAASEVGFEEKTQRVMEEFGKMVQNSSKILFDDSQLDGELEQLRSEIANIRTSTNFIDLQKEKEKLKSRLDELSNQGLTLNAEGIQVPIGSEGALMADEILARKDAEIRALFASEDQELAEDAEINLAEPMVQEAEPSAPVAVDAEHEALTIEESVATTVTTSAIAADTEALAIQINASIEGASTDTAMEHAPSPELEAAAAAAQWERHAQMIADALSETQTEAEVAVVNAEALAEAVTEAKIEQEIHSDIRETIDNEEEPEAGL